jgi:cytochrome c peroxidase
MTHSRVIAIVLAVFACVTTPRVRSESAFAWNLPHGFPMPRVPGDNPMTAAKVALGRYLFYDTRLSGNGQQACATCHEQARAFTDGRARAVGSTGERHPRSSMSLANVGYQSVLTWANPTVTRLEDQALVPMFGDHPIELGLTRGADALIARLRTLPLYQRLFTSAFGDHDAMTVVNITRALASFERTLISGRSPYDRYHFDRDDAAISSAAKRGEQLFFRQPLSCGRCHKGFTLSGAAEFEGRREREPEFHNIGLYNLAGIFSYPEADSGLYDVTKNPGDVGRFKAPTLRNVAVTAPYMHDGSIATLDEVLGHYAAGGRTITDGPQRGVGRDNPNKNPIVRGFALSDDQRRDLIAFLETLTDDALLHDPSLSNPWPSGREDAR